jgi:hypothetical protein
MMEPTTPVTPTGRLSGQSPANAVHQFKPNLVNALIMTRQMSKYKRIFSINCELRILNPKLVSKSASLESTLEGYLKRCGQRFRRRNQGCPTARGSHSPNASWRRGSRPSSAR